MYRMYGFGIITGLFVASLGHGAAASPFPASVGGAYITSFGLGQGGGAARILQRDWEPITKTENQIWFWQMVQGVPTKMGAYVANSTGSSASVIVRFVAVPKQLGVDGAGTCLGTTAGRIGNDVTKTISNGASAFFGTTASYSPPAAGQVLLAACIVNESGAATADNALFLTVNVTNMPAPFLVYSQCIIGLDSGCSNQDGFGGSNFAARVCPPTFVVANAAGGTFACNGFTQASPAGWGPARPLAQATG